MNGFDIFQTVTATMRKITTDGYGDPTVASSFSVDIDPVLGRERVFTQDNEEIEGYSTIISPNSNIDLTHDNWELVYNGRTYQVEGIEPEYDIGTTDVSHYEIKLR